MNAEYENTPISSLSLRRLHAQFDELDETHVGIREASTPNSLPIRQSCSGRAALAAVARGRSTVDATSFAKALHTAEIAPF
jgi:hypothetical protein